MEIFNIQNLHSFLVHNPISTFFLRVSGSVPDLNIKDGDLLIVDRAEMVKPGDLVIAEEAGELKLRIYSGQDVFGKITFTISKK